MKPKFKLLNQFLELESASGIILFFTAILAMILANSSLSFLHQKFIEKFLELINEGLMSVFFLLVGLELKRGFVEGELSNLKQVLLPALAALGGMLAPALIYLLINYTDPITIKGWSIPVATDIAFALGVLSLFGKKIPIALKLFLMALAIFDDIGAIIIIALVYSQEIVYFPLLAAIGLIILLYLLNVYRVQLISIYIIGGVGLWLSLYFAGIHPTLAGVCLALFIPHDQTADSPLNRLENHLHPWVSYLIMPLFALANAGFSLAGISAQILFDKVVVGIVCGLVIGKPLGVFSFSWLAIKTKLAKLPEKSSWLGLYGVATLCGIGFTMSLFLGTLSFQNESIYLSEVRIGVIIGSLISGIIGGLILVSASPALMQTKEQLR